MSYIKKEPLLQIAKELQGKVFGAPLIVREIENAPEEDVVEVVHGKWIGMNGDQCSNCGRSLRDLMDGDSYYSSEFEYSGFDTLVACPFCGAKMN